MDSKLLTALVAAFKRDGFSVAKGRDFVSLVSFRSMKNAYGIANVIDDALSGSNYIASVVDLDEASRREAVFEIKNYETGIAECVVHFVIHRDYHDSMVLIYW